jgi:hypothetical protein
VVRDDGLLQRNRPSRSAAPAQLIDAGHIAPGVVDTRSIEDVTPMIKGFNNAISSPESADGHSHCVAQAGQMIAQHGQHHALANLSARQAKDLGLLTSGTYGPPHIGLSASAALSWSLASNLAALTRRLDRPCTN